MFSFEENMAKALGDCFFNAPCIAVACNSFTLFLMQCARVRCGIALECRHRQQMARLGGGGAGSTPAPFGGDDQSRPDPIQALIAGAAQPIVRLKVVSGGNGSRLGPDDSVEVRKRIIRQC